MPVFDDLKAKLQELFLFDRADFDFGTYRILNAKRAGLTRFFETELLSFARAAHIPYAPSAYEVKLIETEFHRLMWDGRDV